MADFANIYAVNPRLEKRGYFFLEKGEIWQKRKKKEDKKIISYLSFSYQPLALRSPTPRSSSCFLLFHKRRRNNQHFHTPPSILEIQIMSSSSPPLPLLLLSSISQHPLLLLLLLPPLALLLSLLRSRSRLSHIPGPLLASVTNIPRLLWVRGNRAHEVHVELHRRYGPLVRFGPNMVSVGDPAEVGNVYGFGKKWRKVSWGLFSLLGWGGEGCWEREKKDFF